MTHKVTVRIGGLVGSTVWDATNQVAIFDDGIPLLDAGHMYGGDGNACQFQFVLDDDIGEIPRADLTKNLASHNVVTITEDASGVERWIGRGRIADKGWGRKAYAYGDARGAAVTVDDGNVDFRGLALTADWVRPAESGRVRVLAALAAFCNASPRLSTVIGTHLVAAGGEVTMPAKTYKANTDLPEIFRDCATTEGKLWGDVIHHDGGSHLCMLYIDEADHTTYASTLTITDDDPDGVTEFAPAWLQGDASLESGGDNPISHLVSRYGPSDESFVVATNAGIVNAYDYWSVPFNDSLSQSVSQASSRATALAGGRRTEHVTHQPTLRLPADKVHLVEAGMSIQIKSAASMGGQYLGTLQTRRIAQAKKELVAPAVGAVAGQYDVHLQLDRPEKKLGEWTGSPPMFDPPCSPLAAVGTMGSAATLDDTNYDPTVVTGPPAGVERVQMTTTRAAAVGQCILVLTAKRSSIGQEDAVYDSAGNTYTKVAEHEKTGGGGSHTDVCIWFTNVTAVLASGGTIGYEVEQLSGVVLDQGGKCVSAYLIDGTLTGGSESGTATGFDGAPSVVVGGGDLIIAALGLKGGASGFPDTIGLDVDWTAFTTASTAAHSDDSQAVAGGFRLADAGGETWTGTIDQSRDWAMVGAVLTVTPCAEPAPVGATGAGDTGTSNAPAHADHAHEHGSITVGGPYHMAEDVTIADAAGDFTATEVEGALAELQADAEAHVAAVDPHGGYIKESEFTAAGDLLVGTGAATLTRRKNNMAATVTPTVNEDSGDGYSVGSEWYDLTADKAYTALDVTVGAAVWKETTASPTGGTVTVRDEDGTPTGSFDTIKFPNGSVTDNGDGSASVATSGAALGAWTSYTPAWTATTTNPTIGNGTLAGRYKLLDADTMIWQIFLSIGSTTTVGSGTWKFGLPTGISIATTLGRQVGVISILDGGTANYAGSVEFLTGATTTYEMHAADDVAPRNVDNNSPIAWVSGDTLTAAALLEVVQA